MNARSDVLLNAWPLDPCKTSSAPEVRALVEYVYDRILRETDAYSKKPPDPRKVKQNLCTLLINLFSIRISDPRRFVFYSRDPECYTDMTLSYRVLVERVIPGLEQLGYLEADNGDSQAIGWFDRESGVGRRTRTRAAEGLVTLFTSHGLKLHHIEPPVRRFLAYTVQRSSLQDRQ